MGTSIPAFIDALVTAAKAALPDIEVFDGTGATGDPGDFLMVGVADPNPSNLGAAATASELPGPLATTRPRDESGALMCATYSWNGDADQKLARDTATGYMNAVATILRSNPTLGLADGGYFVAQMGDSKELFQGQDSQGADALWLFNILFTARI